MKNFKSRLTKKEIEIITAMVQEIADPYGEFYYTKNNLRLYIRENTPLLFDSLKKGDKIAFSKEGMIIVTGFSDKNPRKYIKFLVKDLKSANDLLRILSWNLTCDLWAKLKKNNPILKVLEANGFSYFKNRGKEILLCRKYIKKDK